MTEFFVDLSEHDWNRRGGAPNWHQLRAAGLDAAAIIRASYGDPKVFAPATLHLGDMVKGAKAAGIGPVGGYHNLIRGDQASIDRQITYHRQQLDKYGVDFSMVDVEAYEELKAKNLTPRWSDLLRWQDRWDAVEPDRVCVWYLARWYWSDWLKKPDLRELRGPLINAHYAGGVGGAKQIYTAAGGDGADGWAPFGNRVPDVVQYTSTASIPGVVKAGVTAAKAQGDVNAFRGTRAELHALLLKRRAANESTVEDDDMDEATKAQLTRIELTLGSLVQGMANTVELPGLPAGVGPTFPIVPNTKLATLEAAVAGLTEKLDQLLSTGGSPDSAPVVAAVRQEAEQIRSGLGEVRAELEQIRTEGEQTRERVADALDSGRE